MQERWAEFEKRGATALVVSFAPPQRLVDYQAALELPFPIGADPERHAYRAYGLTRGSFWQIWGADSLWAYTKLLVRGRSLKRPEEGEDLSQLGGDFIIGPGRSGEPGPLWYTHVSRTPADRPTVAELLQALDAQR